ncbi:hypothetical protein RsS62_56740 [Rhizobium dioscoreae]|nr:hypothetical protein RsS62_56740 [Rhizobium dioscoreae]
MGVGQVIEQTLGTVIEMPARIGHGKGPGGTNQQSNAKIVLECIDLANDRRRGYRTPTGRS